MEDLARCCVRGNIHLDKAKELIGNALALEDRPEWRSWLEHEAFRLKDGDK
jgi:hypothetical protein